MDVLQAKSDLVLRAFLKKVADVKWPEVHPRYNHSIFLSYIPNAWNPLQSNEPIHQPK